MSAGMCSGCHYKNNSCKAVQKHIMSCPDALELMKTNPAALLDPEKELERFNMMEGSREEKDVARDKRYAGYKEEANRKLEKSQKRWTGPRG